jgi:hypothetical protein
MLNLTQNRSSYISKSRRRLRYRHGKQLRYRRRRLGVDSEVCTFKFDIDGKRTFRVDIEAHRLGYRRSRSHPGRDTSISNFKLEGHWCRTFKFTNIELQVKFDTAASHGIRNLDFYWTDSIDAMSVTLQRLRAMTKCKLDSNRARGSRGVLTF